TWAVASRRLLGQQQLQLAPGKRASQLLAAALLWAGVHVVENDERVCVLGAAHWQPVLRRQVPRLWPAVSADPARDRSQLYLRGAESQRPAALQARALGRGSLDDLRHHAMAQ